MQTYRLLFENAFDAILVLDGQSYQIIDANKAAAELYGYGVEQLKQMTGLDLAACPEKMTEAIQRAIEDNGYRSCELWHNCCDDIQVAVDISFSRLLLGERIAVGAIIRKCRNLAKQSQRQDSSGPSCFPDQNTSSQLFLPICASCKKIRDSQENWTPIENYMSQLFAIKFSHSICPVCMNRLYPQTNSYGRTRKLSQKELNEQRTNVE